MPLLSYRGARKTYGSVVALAGLDLEVEPGEVLSLLGPNGAGKTTTLRLAAGLVRPDRGTVTVGGHPAGSLAAKAMTAYVPDEPSVYDRLTGVEFLEFTARLHRIPDATARIAAATERFHLQGFADRLCEGYSHGQRQRLVLASAHLLHPRVLIVDEPLVGLDPQHIRIVLSWLRELADGGGAVVVSTHTLSTVEEVSDRVAIMRLGEMAAYGTVSEVAGDQGLEARFLALTGG
ncbi:MAG: hypothetical protein RLZZ127_2849 [Planctomycetota bacterium]|jgi:ABC-2 type transport system ATP-binding protein